MDQKKGIKYFFQRDYYRFLPRETIIDFFQLPPPSPYFPVDIREIHYIIYYIQIFSFVNEGICFLYIL